MGCAPSIAQSQRFAQNPPVRYNNLQGLARVRSRMGRWWTALLVTMLALAGCSDEPAAEETPQLQEAVQAAQQVEVQATAKTGVIRGVVVDDALRPLAGALVSVTGVEQNKTTNDLGVFAFQDLEPGTYFLTASMVDYTTVQQSVEVVAGVDNPEAIKILLAAIPRATPFIEALNAMIFISGSGWVELPGVGGTGITVGGAGVLSSGNWNFEVEIQPNGTVAQTELNWDPTSPLGENGRAAGGTYDGNTGIDTAIVTGAAPLAIRANATEGEDTADNVYYSFYAWASAGTPVGFAFNQQVDVFVHVFHNFLPNDGWLFSRDGEHPIPSR